MAHAKLNSFRKSALALLLAGAVITPAAAQDLGATPVTWVNGSNVQVNGNTLSEACNGCSDAGAESQQMLTSGDGYVEFVAGQGVFAVGIGGGGSNGQPGTKLEDIEYGLYFNGNGSVEVRENGGVYQIDTRYQPGDRFRIALQNGVISYHKYEGNNLAVNYTSKSPAQIQYPAKIEAILLGAGSQVSQAVVRQGTIPATAQAQQAGQGQQQAAGQGQGQVVEAGYLTWTNTNGVSVNGGSLTSTTDQQNGAQSNETLSGDGFIEFTAAETDKMRAIGLDAQSGASGNFQEIDFAIVLREAADGRSPVAEVWESGTYISDVPYTSGDRFRIGIENGVVKYYKLVNGQPQQIQARDSRVTNFPVHVDAALYSQQATLHDVTGTRLN